MTAPTQQQAGNREGERFSTLHLPPHNTGNYRRRTRTVVALTFVFLWMTAGVWFPQAQLTKTFTIFSVEDDNNMLMSMMASSSSSISSAWNDTSSWFSLGGQQPQEPQRVYNRTLSMIVVYGWGMCNHLSWLTHAHVMKRYVEREIPGVRLRLIGEHIKPRPSDKGRDDFVKCFPSFRNFGTLGGKRDKDFAPIKEQQEAWLGDQTKLLRNIATQEQIDFLKSLLDQQEQTQQQDGEGGNHDINNKVPPTEWSPNHTSKYSIPYLTSEGMQVNEDEFARHIRPLFQFDMQACCKARADPNETVFHFRNFITEFGSSAGMGKGEHNFHELSPNDTVELLFNKNLPLVKERPKKVAIISRFVRTAKPYLKAFQARGWEARLIEGQTGVQDFCFAMSAKTLVGHGKSTYTMWAGRLGNATLVRDYNVHTEKRAGYRSETTQVIAGKPFVRELYGRRDRVMSRARLREEMGGRPARRDKK